MRYRYKENEGKKEGREEGRTGDSCEKGFALIDNHNVPGTEMYDLLNLLSLRA